MGATPSTRRGYTVATPWPDRAVFSRQGRRKRAPIRGLRGWKRLALSPGERWPGSEPEACRFAEARPPWASWLARFQKRANMSTLEAQRSRRVRRALAPGIIPGGFCSRCVCCGPAGDCADETPRKSGRCGDWVWYWRNDHQWRRLWVKPFDPKTAKQRAWRARLAAASTAYSEELTQEQQEACIAEGAKRQTKPRLEQSGPETGQQYSVGKACKENPPALAPNARKPKS
jgi:hypothetical protein